MTRLIVSNEERNDIMKIVRSLEDAGLLIKIVSETIKNEAKEHKGVMIADEDTIRSGEGIIRAGEGTIRVGQDF